MKLDFKLFGYQFGVHPIFPRLYWDVMEFDVSDDTDICEDYATSKKINIGASFATHFSVGFCPVNLGYITLSLFGFGIHLDWYQKKQK